MLRSSRNVGAVQGRYVAAGTGSLFSRVMALDLEQRYAHLSDTVDHVCTGNSAYRVSALEAVGLLNEDLGYGYDNDLSYRLGAAGYRLIFRRDARSRHSWRDGVVGYLTQQYGFGYGRLDVVAAHPTRIAGDAVSPAWMMAQPVITAVALICFVAALITLAWCSRARWQWSAWWPGSTRGGVSRTPRRWPFRPCTPCGTRRGSRPCACGAGGAWWAAR